MALNAEKQKQKQSIVESLRGILHSENKGLLEALEMANTESAVFTAMDAIKGKVGKHDHIIGMMDFFLSDDD